MIKIYLKYRFLFTIALIFPCIAPVLPTSSYTPVTFTTKERTDVYDNPITSAYNNPEGKMRNVHLYQFEDKKTQLYGYKFYKNHKIAVSPQYAYAWPFNQYGIAVVRVFNNGLHKHHIINTKGVNIADCYTFDNGPDYYSKFGLSRIVKNGKMGCINFKGKIVVPPKFDYIERFLPPGIASVANGCTLGEGEYPMMMGGKWGLINAAGKLVVPIEYDSISFEYKKNAPQIGENDIGTIRLMRGKEAYTLCKDSAGEFCAIKMGDEKTGSFGP